MEEKETLSRDVAKMCVHYTAIIEAGVRNGVYQGCNHCNDEYRICTARIKPLDTVCGGGCKDEWYRIQP